MGIESINGDKDLPKDPREAWAFLAAQYKGEMRNSDEPIGGENYGNTNLEREQMSSEAKNMLADTKQKGENFLVEMFKDYPEMIGGAMGLLSAGSLVLSILFLDDAQKMVDFATAGMLIGATESVACVAYRVIKMKI